MDRGILSTIYARPKRPTTDAEVLKILRDAYAGERFVRIVDHLPGTKDTVDTNFIDITARVATEKLSEQGFRQTWADAGEEQWDHADGRRAVLREDENADWVFANTAL